MTRPIIAIDVDDVLAANAEGFIAFSNRQWNMSLTVDDYDEHWMQVWGVDLDETLRRSQLFHDSQIVQDYRHDSTADSVLRILSDRFDLHIVTSRRLILAEVTRAWLHTHYAGVFSDDMIHFAGIWDGAIDHGAIHQTKADIIDRIGADYLIDDQLKHCQAVAARDKKAVLFGQYNWNATDALPSGVTRCVDWAAVGDYFDAVI